MKRILFTLACAVLNGTAAMAAPVADLPVVTITLKDHRFSPDVIPVPAGQKIRIDVTNRDATADDFDSDALHVDRDLKPHEHASFVIGPLKPGSYAFKGELHAATAHGEVIAKAPAGN
jgi:plastocyanin